MKIWIDFINSPQVSFFEPLINELTKKGDEFILTCRDSANTVDLIRQRGWTYTIIGKRAEKGTVKKLLAFPARIRSLFNFLKQKNIEVAICQSSFYLPLTAKMLRIPSIYTNDNEHALGNIPAFLFATKILIPENLSLEKVYKKGASKRKVVQYPGIKEGVYLWIKGVEIINRRNAENVKKSVYIRPEPLTAQYYTGKLNFLDDLLVAIKEKYPVIILARDKIQRTYYSQSKFLGISLPEKPISFEEVSLTCELFIGAGGSMTRELALIGIPTVSVYQGELLEVDTFLIKEKLMLHRPTLQFAEVEKMLERSPLAEPDMRLIEKGKKAYELFKSELLKYKK